MGVWVLTPRTPRIRDGGFGLYLNSIILLLSDSRVIVSTDLSQVIQVNQEI